MKKTNHSKHPVGLSLFCMTLLLLVSEYPSLGNMTQPGSEKQAIQNIAIKGTVTDEDGAPIPNVAVVVKGKTEKVMTSEDGKYVISAGADDVLTFLCGGYRYKEASVEGQSTVDVALTETYDHTDYLHYNNILYGQQSKTNTTGAYSQILGKEVETRAMIHNSNRYTGMLAGLFVMQDNGETGSETATMWVRGKRTFRGKGPVVLVDGYERDAGRLDPNEIESITVLKDAAATARYGLRSGNGIVQITTKRGEEGKIRINLHARAGVKAPTTTPKLLDSYDYATLYNEAQSNDGVLPADLKYSSTHLDKYMQAREGTLTDEYDKYLYPDINWYDDYMKKHTWQQRYSMSVDGGNKFAKYFVSFGFTNNSGIYNVDKSANTYNTNANQKLYTIRSNVDVNVTSPFFHVAGSGRTSGGKNLSRRLL
jgi:TonB-dependent SusC/RagA subfamily outer membrane receptor